MSERDLRVDPDVVDTVTEALHRLRTSRVPCPVPIPETLPDDEMRQLLVFLNRFLVEFSVFSEALARIAQGDLDARPPLGTMEVVQNFKTLQSNLRHLTWKTQQVAGGDLGQQVDFMGDFSVAFNSMTRQLAESREQLLELNHQLERRNRFIRETFGRYTSDDIVGLLLDAPGGLALGGEKRDITLLMSDLRGFTAMVERLEPAVVVTLLNDYLSVMVEVIQGLGGTIDEIIGDAIFVLFGAPVPMEDAARRAVRCALEMQHAMSEVNGRHRESGWPEIEMGIALHHGEAVVGNIGSTKRSKFGVVGRVVNMTARIEGYSVGGQILASPDLLRKAGEGLILGESVEILAKGMHQAIVSREVLGLEECPDLTILRDGDRPVPLPEPLPLACTTVVDKHLGEFTRRGAVVSLSRRRAVLEVADALAPRTDLVLRFDLPGEGLPDLYAKLLRVVEEAPMRYLIHFTSVPPSVGAWLQEREEAARACPPS